MKIQSLSVKCLKFSKDFLDEAAKSPKEDLHHSFIYRHGRNVWDIGKDLFFLRDNNRKSVLQILARAMLESFFNLVAATKDNTFAANKLAYELSDQSDRIRKYQATQSPELSALLDAPILAIDTQLRSIVAENGIGKTRRFTTSSIAAAAKLEENYVREYFLFSMHSHASTAAIILQEYQHDRDISATSALYMVVNVPAYSAKALIPSKAQYYVDEAAKLLAEINSLPRSKAPSL